MPYHTRDGRNELIPYISGNELQMRQCLTPRGTGAMSWAPTNGAMNCKCGNALSTRATGAMNWAPTFQAMNCEFGNASPHEKRAQ